MRPFLAGGPSFRTYSNPQGSRPSRYGVTGGAGVELAAGQWRIAPSVRYTRWASDERTPFRPTLRNQVEFVLSTGYATEARQRELWGGKVWLGVIAGVPLTGDLHHPESPGAPYSGDNSRIADFRFAAGVMAEIPLGSGWSIEANGLYRRLHYRDSPAVVVTWQIPVLAKYTFERRRLQPFLEGGPSFRLAGNLNSSNPSHYGVTAGAGITAKAARMRLTPVLRYTRWAQDARTHYTSQYFTRLDQVELLVGIAF